MSDLSQYGINPEPPKTAEIRVIGRTKTVAGLDSIEWSFLTLSIVSVLGTIGLTIERIVEYSVHPTSYPSADQDITFAIVLLVNACFCILYILNGILRERQYELYVFVGAYCVVLGYCIFEYVYNADNQSDIKLARMIIGSVFALPTIGLAVTAARQFGWLEFRIVGAAESLQQMYRQACFFFSLLNFDLQAELSFIVFALRNGWCVGTSEIISLAVGIPFSLAWRIIGWLATVRENKKMSWLFIASSLVEPTYIGVRLAYDFQRLGTDSMQPVNGASQLLLYCTLAAGAIALFVRFVSLYEFSVVYGNFGHGLRDRAFPQDPEEAGLLSQQPRERHVRYT